MGTAMLLVGSVLMASASRPLEVLLLLSLRSVASCSPRNSPERGSVAARSANCSWYTTIRPSAPVEASRPLRLLHATAYMERSCSCGSWASSTQVSSMLVGRMMLGIAEVAAGWKADRGRDSFRHMRTVWSSEQEAMRGPEKERCSLQRRCRRAKFSSFSDL